MRRRTILIIVSAVVAVAAITGIVVWATAVPYSETLSKCKTALAAQTKAGVKGKPSACSDVKDADYSEILVANALAGMSKKDRDALDYYDNGTIDGSIG